MSKTSTHTELYEENGSSEKRTRQGHLRRTVRRPIERTEEQGRIDGTGSRRISWRERSDDLRLGERDQCAACVDVSSGCRALQIKENPRTASQRIIFSQNFCENLLTGYRRNARIASVTSTVRKHDFTIKTNRDRLPFAMTLQLAIGRPVFYCRF